MRRRIVSLVIAMVTLFSVFGSSYADVKNFDLIEYLQMNEVGSREELMSVISSECHNPDVSMCTYSQAYACDLNEVEVSFEYVIDYENNVVVFDTVYQSTASSYTTSGRAYHDVCSASGNVLYTVAVNATFTRTSQTVTASSANSTFTPGSSSSWTSTPTTTRGYISRTQAYARASGVASCPTMSQSYKLTLMCDTSGSLTSTFSS